MVSINGEVILFNEFLTKHNIPDFSFHTQPDLWKVTNAEIPLLAFVSHDDQTAWSGTWNILSGLVPSIPVYTRNY